MPQRLRGICSYPFCKARAVARGRCASHPRPEMVRGEKRVSAGERGYGSDWRRIRAAHLKQCPACVVCGLEDQSNNVDHIIPKAQGGTDDESNLQTLCHVHHSKKTAIVDGGFGNKP